MLKVFFHPQAGKELLKIHRKIRLKILNKITELEHLDHPLQHQKVIKLRGRKTKDFRLRIDDYRVKFTLRNSSAIFITHVQHRQVGY